MVEGAVRESAKDREAGQVQNSESMLSWRRERSSNGGGGGGGGAGGMGRNQTQAIDQGFPLGSEDGQRRASCSAAAARG